VRGTVAEKAAKHESNGGEGDDGAAKRKEKELFCIGGLLDMGKGEEKDHDGRKSR